jgi:hypothetical protein
MQCHSPSVSIPYRPINFESFYMESTDYMDYLECSSVIATRNLSVAFDSHCGDALERSSTCLPIDTRRRMDQRSASASPFNSFFVATMDQAGQTCCLNWNLRTTPLVRSELSTPPSRPVLGSLLRSPLTCCSACDLRFRFRKTYHNG